MASTLTHSIFTTSASTCEQHRNEVNDKMKYENTNSGSKPNDDISLDTTVDETVQLLQRLTQKDADALAKLYDAHAGLLMSVIMNVLKDKAESEDILQDSFIAIYNKAEMYSAHLGKPINWMATIARNKAYDRYRKLVRRTEGMDGLKHEFAIRGEMTNSSPKIVNEELHAGVQELSVEQRAAIELVFYEGLTQAEAAAKLNAPLGTVKARIRRGLLKLKQCVTKK